MLVIPIKPLMQTLQHFDKISVQLLQLKGENISKEVYEMILYGVADKLAASMKSDQAVLYQNCTTIFKIQSLQNLRTTLCFLPLNKQIPLAITGFFVDSIQYLVNL